MQTKSIKARLAVQGGSLCNRLPDQDWALDSVLDWRDKNNPPAGSLSSTLD